LTAHGKTLLDSADMVDFIMRRGNLTWISAFIINCIFSRGNSKMEFAVIALYLSLCGREIQESADI